MFSDSPECRLSAFGMRTVELSWIAWWLPFTTERHSANLLVEILSCDSGSFKPLLDWSTWRSSSRQLQQDIKRSLNRRRAATNDLMNTLFSPPSSYDWLNDATFTFWISIFRFFARWQNYRYGTEACRNAISAIMCDIQYNKKDVCNSPGKLHKFVVAPPHFGKVKKYMEASPHVTSLMFKDRGINVPTLSRSLGWHMTNAREPFELLPSTMPHTTKTFGMMGFFVHN